MYFVYFIVFFLIFSPLNAADKTTSLSVVEKVERNLIYSSEVEKPNTTDAVIIKKGAWTQDDIKKLEDADPEEKKIETKVKKTKNDTTVLAIKRKAYDAMSVGQYEIAVSLYKKALAINKNDVYSTLGLATAYQYLGQYMQAKPLYLKVLETFPTDQQVMSNLLAIVSDETPYEAVYLLSNIADRNLNSPLIQAQTSNAYSKIKNYDKAIEYIKRAIESDDSNIEYKFNLAVLYDLNQEYSKARSAYNELIALYNVGDSSNTISLDEIQNRINAIDVILLNQKSDNDSSKTNEVEKTKK